MKKYVFAIAFILLIIWNISLVYTNSKGSERDANIKAENDYQLKAFDNMKRNVVLSFYNDLLQVRNPQIYFGNDSLNKYVLSKKLKGKTLIFRFSGNYCDDCITKIIEKIKMIFPDYASNDKIIFVCSELNPRLKDSFYGKPIVSFVSEDFGLPMEKTFTPFLFLLNEFKATEMVYVPMQAEPELTERYLMMVKPKLLTNAKSDQ